MTSSAHRISLNICRFQLLERPGSYVQLEQSDTDFAQGRIPGFGESCLSPAAGFFKDGAVPCRIDMQKTWGAKAMLFIIPMPEERSLFGSIALRCLIWDGYVGLLFFL